MLQHLTLYHSRHVVTLPPSALTGNHRCWYKCCVACTASFTACPPYTDCPLSCRHASSDQFFVFSAKLYGSNFSFARLITKAGSCPQYGKQQLHCKCYNACHYPTCRCNAKGVWHGVEGVGFNSSTFRTVSHTGVGIVNETIPTSAHP